jgi:hypothetical protein
MGKPSSIIVAVKDAGFGDLRAFITKITNDDKPWFVGHIYGPGDCDSEHWCFRRRSASALLKAMEKRFTAYNKQSPKAGKRSK